MSTDKPANSSDASAAGASPWARPSGEDATAQGGPMDMSKPGSSAVAPQAAQPGPFPPAAATPYVAPGQGASPFPPGWQGGRPDVVVGGAPRNDRTLLWLGLGGGGLLLIALIVIVVLAVTGAFTGDPRGPEVKGSGPAAGGPPLAQACPPVRDAPKPGPPLPAPPGPRLADEDAGISYAQLADPWRPWNNGTWRGGTLGVEFRNGFYVVTETYPEGRYLASVLSGKVAATVGDSLSLNLECAGKQVTEDVRNSYYPRPNKKEAATDEPTTLGGRPAWVSKFHLTFQAEGLEARGETVAVVLVDVGRPAAAVLYVSIPDTHQHLTPQIDALIASVRPL